MMIDAETNRPVDADTRRAALEVIATLVNVKRLAADHLLRPAGVPDDLIKLFLSGRDPTANEAYTKRQSGALILADLEHRGTEGEVVRKLLKIAADWTAFHLAGEEYKARAAVQKAREVQG
ncbi:MAG: hypothetical protein JWL84_2461, partial [Rhodospirillales bacterium]|nr:hypothetical protein [Rhodospirillales bacterium]